MIDAATIKAALDAIAGGDPEAISTALTAVLAALVTGDSEPPADAAADALTEGADAPLDPKEVAATTSALRKLTGCASAGEAIAFLTTLKAQVDSLAADRDALDMSSRRELVGELVKLGVELPATAWGPEELDAAGKPKPRTPAKRFLSEPLEELRNRVVMLRGAKGGTAPKHTAPETGASTETLSADQKVIADKITDPKKKARFLEMCAKSPLTSKGNQ